MRSYFSKHSLLARFALAAAVVAAVSSFAIHASSVTWNAGDIFVGFDNQFGGGDPNAAHWRAFDPAGAIKDDVSQVDNPSYVSACAFDATSSNTDFWATGYWDNTVRHYGGAAPHALLHKFDLTALTNGGAVSSIVFTNKTLSPGVTEQGFYVSATYTKGGLGAPTNAPDQTNLFYFKTGSNGTPVAMTGTPDATFILNTNGFRGVDWIDLSVNQRTLYYSSLEDNGLRNSEIRTFDLVTRTQGAAITLTTDGSTPLSTKVLAFRVLPPGDGSGGFLVATDMDVFRVDPTGRMKQAFTHTPDFMQQMASRGLPTDYSFFIDTNVTNDGEYVWAASYPGFDDTGAVDASGNEIFTLSTPGKLFKFHIPTGSVQAGPYDLGANGDTEFADAICMKREYIAAVEQPPCPVGSTDYRCAPPPDCANPVIAQSNAHCKVPGGPAITALVDNQRVPAVTYASPTSSTRVTNLENDTVKVQIVATSGTANPALSYGAVRLPLGLSLNTTTGLITGVVSYAAAGECGQWCGVQVTATNADGRSVMVTFQWEIIDVSSPPVIGALGNLTFQHGVPITPIPLTATDLDVNEYLAFSLQPAVPGLTIGATTQVLTVRTAFLSGTPTVAPGVSCPAGVCSVTATTLLVDDHGRAVPLPSQLIGLTVSVLNLPPTMVQPADQLARPGLPFSLQISAADPNVDGLTYSIATSPAVSGLVISASGLITGSPAIGTYVVNVTAADGHDGSVTKTFTLKVTNNSAPVCSAATAYPSQLWPPNHKFNTIAIKGITDPDGDATTIKFTRILQDEQTIAAGHYEGDGCNGHHHTSNDEWDDWSDNGSGNTSIDGLISGTNQSVAQVRSERSGEANGRIYDIRFTATDTAGNTCTGAVTVGVPHDQGGMPVAIDSLVRFDSTVAGGAPLQGPGFNLAPVYANPGDQTTSISKPVTLATTATDLNLDTLTYAATGLPAGLTIKSTTGVISGTPTTATTANVTLTVSDPYGGSATVSFKWTIVPNRPPVAVSNTVTLSKGGSITVNVLSNDSDPDGDALKVTSISGSYNGTATITGSGTTINYKPSSSFVGTTQFVYTISDGRGGTATATLRINVLNHSTGDKCDHDKHKNGHYDGDGCDHDRACRSHN